MSLFLLLIFIAINNIDYSLPRFSKFLLQYLLYFVYRNLFKNSIVDTILDIFTSYLSFLTLFFKNLSNMPDNVTINIPNFTLFL